MNRIRRASILLAALLAVSPAFAQPVEEEEEEELQPMPNPEDLVGDLGFFPGGGLFHNELLRDFMTSTGELSYGAPGSTEAGPQPEPPTDPVLWGGVELDDWNSITIEAIDPCESCDDEVPDLVRRFDPDYVFAGTEKVKVAGAGRAVDGAMLMLEVGDLGAFIGADETDRRYLGMWVPVGKSGRKFELFLHEIAVQQLAEKIAEQANTLLGSPVSVALTSLRITVKFDRNGLSPTLKIKGKGVTSATGAAVRYKAKLKSSSA